MRWVELRCPCGPSRRGRFLLRYRPSVFAPAPEATDPESDPANDLVIKCRYCKRLHALVGVHSLDDLRTQRHVPFSRVGAPASDAVAV